MRKAVFVLGEVFPAEDPVARFVTAMAIAHNDMSRLYVWAVDGDETTAENIHAFRLHAAIYFEAAVHLKETPRRFPVVRDFLAALPMDAQQDLSHVIGTVTAGNTRFLDWAEPHRNVTHHVAEMHPDKFDAGKEELGNAIRAAAALETSISFGDDTTPGHYHFADEVAVQFFPETSDHEAMIDLREAVLAHRRLTPVVVTTYCEQGPVRERMTLV